MMKHGTPEEPLGDTGAPFIQAPTCMGSVLIRAM
jgi:hypothetical protein